MAKLRFEAIVTGRVNGADIFVRGSGSIDEESGITDGVYDISKLPRFYAPGLLTACILTGYPNASSSTTEHKNPFQGQSYGYERQLCFGSTLTLSYSAECTLDGAKLLSHFCLNGDIPVIELPESFSQLIEERWQTDSASQLRGEFEASWNTVDSNRIAAFASSNYRFRLPEELSALRRLRLQALTRDDEFFLLQESRLT